MAGTQCPGSDRGRGITLARNPDGRLEAALLNTHTVWHAWQTRPDGNWSSWDSLDKPVPGATLSSPTPASDKGGRLELFTTRPCDAMKERSLPLPSGWVEQVIALLHWFRRLRIRWEIRDDIHEAFLTLGCAIICWRRLKIHALS